MKKIINGKKYDTETAKCLATAYSSLSPTDFGYWSERLYLKKTGEYFLHGEGGPMSKYGVKCGTNSWGWGSRIIPYTEGEAMAWAEEHLDGDEFEQIFGEVEE